MYFDVKTKGLALRVSPRGRAEVVGPRGPETDHAPATDAAEPAPAPGDRAESAGGHNRSWATLIERTFGLDVLACPRCSGRLRLIALIERAAVIRRILGHRGLPTEVPLPRPARCRPTIPGPMNRPWPARVEGVEWFWPAPAGQDAGPDETARLLSPFDPIVWDRRRFELLWNWAYRFEAYTPAARHRFGYYALPMLWRDHVVGWANATASGDRFDIAFGYAAGHTPRTRVFARELDAEAESFRSFLRLPAESTARGGRTGSGHSDPPAAPGR